MRARSLYCNMQPKAMSGYAVNEGFKIYCCWIEHKRPFAKTQACRTLDKISELQWMVNGLNNTVHSWHLRLADLVNAERIGVLSVITAALSESLPQVST